MDVNDKGNKRLERSISSTIPKRLNILLIVVLVMLGMLVYKTYSLQIKHYKYYKDLVYKSKSTIIKEPVERGEIYDSRGKLIVGNKTIYVVQYNKPQNITSQQEYNIANKIGKYIKVNTAPLTNQTYVTYYLLNNKRAEYAAKKANITYAPETDGFIKEITKYIIKNKKEFPLSDLNKNKAMIFQKIINGYPLSIVKINDNKLSDNEIAAIASRKSSMPGISIGKEYERTYPAGNDIKSLVGGIGSIPYNKVNNYIQK